MASQLSTLIDLFLFSAYICSLKNGLFSFCKIVILRFRACFKLSTISLEIYKSYIINKHFL